MKNEIKNTTEQIKLSIENVQNDKYIISGLAVKLGERSRNGVIYEDLTFEEKSPLLNEHNPEQRLGYVNFEKVGNDINFIAKFNEKNKLSMEVWEQVKHGDVSNVSIGAYISDGSWEDNYETFIATKGELMELSVVSTPGFKDAKIKTIESLSKEKIENKEKIKMEIKDMKHSELVEAFNNATEKLRTSNIKIEDLSKKLSESIDVDVASELAETKANETKLSEALNKEIEEMSHAIEMKENLLNDLKKGSDQNNKKQFKENIVENKHFENSYLKTEKATNDFKKVMGEAISKGENFLTNWKSHLSTEGFTGDLAALFPTQVATDIQDTMEKVGSLMPFIEQVYGVSGKISFLVNESEELGFGWQGASAAKVEQNNVLTEISIDLQYVYKYVTVSRELLDQPGDVLYKYIVKELAERLIATIERAIVIGDGLLPTDTKKIKSIVPMVSTPVLCNTVVDIAEFGIETLDTLEDELIGNGRTIHVMHKKTYSKIKNSTTTTGERVYEIGSVTIGANTYNTLDGNIVVENRYMKPFDNAVDGDVVIVAFKEMKYKLISTQQQAEMFMDFELQTNTREFLTEINIGGNAVSPKCIAIGMKAVV